ncbi:gliding motility lipoprotein GldH [Marixanthomonas spongiae]|uniref:Gliding motility lipoprotein GldH n=1 Tax=Marixanthomonas spongiae TaxID=2174845 RepID=A0A2U0I1T4_9FLAO|nr:gliding motility lipoprotein GldH [Marixanthomonas spongiae]PVW15069.1 gliding motility lipoprotein GldH [Marixanthomonas spongiae]
MRKLFFIAMAVALASCNTDAVMSDTQSLPNYWDKNDTISFTIPQLDSLKQYNVFLHLRNTNDYRFNNLFLIVSMEFPHGKTIQDTLEYRMAKPSGEWLGEGIGNLKENKFWFREGVRFPEEGTYTLRIMQAVRNNGEVEGVTKLKGITDVGYSIEEASQQQ